MVLVVVYVVVYFVETPVGAGLGDHVVAAAFVSVPEAAVYKDDGVVAGEDNVGLAGEVFYVEPVAVSEGMEVAPHEHFGLCVFAFDA